MTTLPRVFALVLAAMAFVPNGLSANLLEPLQSAKARATGYSKRYKAVDPIFRTDAKGMVVMECWAAPPEMWPQATAIAFGRELAPEKLRSSTPKALPPDGGERAFVWADGTQIVLRAFQNKITSVEVRLKSYTGNRC
jgi:hypothetical protein